MQDTNLTNVDVIIKELQKLCKQIKTFEKLDGITIECTVTNSKKLDNGIKEVTDVCKNLNLIQISIEKSSTKNTSFALQFPELNVYYSEDIITKMYEDNFKWLFDNIMEKPQSVNIDKTFLLQNKDMLVKQAISTYCRSNINPYKENVKDYLNNTEYIRKISTIYILYLDKYWDDMQIK